MREVFRGDGIVLFPDHGDGNESIHMLKFCTPKINLIVH